MTPEVRWIPELKVMHLTSKSLPERGSWGAEDVWCGYETKQAYRRLPVR